MTLLTTEGDEVRPVPSAPRIDDAASLLISSDALRPNSLPPSYDEVVRSTDEVKLS